MSQATKKFRHAIAKWVLPRADYIFTTIWLACIIIFKAHLSNKVLLTSYLTTLALIFILLKYKNTKTSKRSSVFSILYCLLTALGIGTIIFIINSKQVVVFNILGNSMSPNFNEGDIVHIQKKDNIYSRGDAVVYDSECLFDGMTATEMVEMLNVSGFTTSTPTSSTLENIPTNTPMGIPTIMPTSISTIVPTSISMIAPTSTPLSPSSQGLDLQGGLQQLMEADICTEVWIGRIIGLPTEKVIIQNGEISIDGKVLSEPYVNKDFPNTYTFDYIVPVGSYFILQDNRESGYDSTEFGGIQEKQIRGKILETFNSTKGMFEQKASAWLLILTTFLLPILISRKFSLPKTLRIFVAQYNLFCFFILLLLVAYPFSNLTSDVKWFYPSNIYYQMTTFIQEITETSPFSVPINLIFTLIGVALSIMEMQDYMDKKRNRRTNGDMDSLV